MAEKEEKPRHFAWLADPNAAPPRDEGLRYFSHLYDKREPGTSEKTPSLDDALKSFAQRSPLEDALKQFANQSPVDDALRAFAAEKKPPPWAPVRPPPEPPRSSRPPGNSAPPTASNADETPFDQLLKFGRSRLLGEKPPPEPLYVAPTHAADVHMKTVLELIEEADAASDRASLTSIEAVNIVIRLRTAAEHLVEARSTNPDAKILVTPKKGEPYEQTIDDLAVRLLRREGLLCVRAAARWEGAHKEGRDFLDQARTAFQSAIKYHPHSADLHYQLAEVFKLLGLNKAAIEAANKALKCDPEHIDTVRFLHDPPTQRDIPLWQDKPRVEPRRDYYVRYWLIGVGLFGFFFSPAFLNDDAKRNLLFVPAVFAIVALMGIFMAYNQRKTNKAIEQRYREFESAQISKDMKDLWHEMHSTRYREEQEQRRRDGP